MSCSYSQASCINHNYGCCLFQLFSLISFTTTCFCSTFAIVSFYTSSESYFLFPVIEKASLHIDKEAETLIAIFPRQDLRGKPHLLSTAMIQFFHSTCSFYPINKRLSRNFPKIIRKFLQGLLFTPYSSLWLSVQRSSCTDPLQPGVFAFIIALIRVWKFFCQFFGTERYLALQAHE